MPSGRSEQQRGTHSQRKSSGTKIPGQNQTDLAPAKTQYLLSGRFPPPDPRQKHLRHGVDDRALRDGARLEPREGSARGRKGRPALQAEILYYPHLSSSAGSGREARHRHSSKKHSRRDLDSSQRRHRKDRIKTSVKEVSRDPRKKPERTTVAIAGEQRKPKPAATGFGYGYGYGYGASRQNQTSQCAGEDDYSTDSSPISDEDENSDCSVSSSAHVGGSDGSIAPMGDWEDPQPPQQELKGTEMEAEVEVEADIDIESTSLGAEQAANAGTEKIRRSVSFKEEVLVFTDTSQETAALAASRQGKPRRRFKEPPPKNAGPEAGEAVQHFLSTTTQRHTDGVAIKDAPPEELGLGRPRSPPPRRTTLQVLTTEVASPDTEGGREVLETTIIETVEEAPPSVEARVTTETAESGTEVPKRKKDKKHKEGKEGRKRRKDKRDVVAPEERPQESQPLLNLPGSDGRRLDLDHSHTQPEAEGSGFFWGNPSKENLLAASKKPIADDFWGTSGQESNRSMKPASISPFDVGVTNQHGQVAQSQAGGVYASASSHGRRQRREASNSQSPDDGRERRRRHRSRRRRDEQAEHVWPATSGWTGVPMQGSFLPPTHQAQRHFLALGSHYNLPAQTQHIPQTTNLTQDTHHTKHDGKTSLLQITPSPTSPPAPPAPLASAAASTAGPEAAEVLQREPADFTAAAGFVHATQCTRDQDDQGSTTSKPGLPLCAQKLEARATSSLRNVEIEPDHKDDVERKEEDSDDELASGLQAALGGPKPHLQSQDAQQSETNSKPVELPDERPIAQNQGDAGSLHGQAEVRRSKPKMNEQSNLHPWPRSIRWKVPDGQNAVGSLRVLRIPPELRWKPSSLNSVVVKERTRKRTQLVVNQPAGELDSTPPAPPPNPDGCQTSEDKLFLEKTTEDAGLGKRRIRLAGEWRTPPALILPPELVRWDVSLYRGIELTCRSDARVQQQKARDKATPSAPSSPPQAAVSALASLSYTEKLVALMSQLESPTAMPDALVPNFWAILSVSERARFTTEFPQFLSYLPANAKAAAVTGPEPRPQGTASVPCVLRVSGLGAGSTAKDLAQLFSPFGQLLGSSVKRIRSQAGNWTEAGGLMNRIGFVQFASASDAQKAIRELNGSVFGGRAIAVDVSQGSEAEV